MFWVMGIGKRTSLLNWSLGLQPKKLGLGQDIPLEWGTSVKKAEAPVITAARLCLAAEQTSFAAPEGTNARHFAEAGGAVVKIITGHAPRGSEREGVTALFGPEAEIAAGQAPLGAMRINEATRMARMGDKVGQLMEKGAGQFLRKRKQARIEQNHRAIKPRQAGGGPQAGVPMECDARGQPRQFQADGPGTGFTSQSLQSFCRMRGSVLESACGHGVGAATLLRGLVQAKQSNELGIVRGLFQDRRFLDDAP